MTRRSLTANQRVRIFDDNKGHCHICKTKIHIGEPWEADHVIPRGLTGKDNLEEYKPAHITCHKTKTKVDNRTVKRAVRVRAKHLGTAKEKQPPSKLVRGCDGVVRDRETREPVR